VAHQLLSYFDKVHFSDYDASLAFILSCPKCEASQPVSVPWSNLREGFCGNDKPEKNATSPWLVKRHLLVACNSCSTPLTVYLSGAAGGRHGEIQYGLAGLSYENTTLA
jgi:hypothetical protein